MHLLQCGSAMVVIRSIVARFPQRELEIRRRCIRDAHFKSVCEDYEEAAAALQHWQNVVREGGQKVEEYTNFVGELETEILTKLDN
jgi:hypothetical protein